MCVCKLGGEEEGRRAPLSHASGSPLSWCHIRHSRACRAPRDVVARSRVFLVRSDEEERRVLSRHDTALHTSAPHPSYERTNGGGRETTDSKDVDSDEGLLRVGLV